jgi:hypothetical protein
MLLRELINETIRMKDEVKQRKTIVEIGLIRIKDELNEMKSRNKKEQIIDENRIIKETDFKSLGLTNQKQRDNYIFEEQEELRKRQMEEVNDQKYLLEEAERREKELTDEYVYYTDRLNLLMKIYDIEGEIEVEDIILEEREKIGSDEDD